MACSAVGAELTVVMIVVLMTGIAIGGSALEYIIGMARAASRLDVCAGQVECG
jgi:hypothetical protein